MANKTQSTTSTSTAVARKSSQKQLSNPTSTGGLGAAYEARVQAVYLLALLTGEPTPLLEDASIVGLRFQAKIHGYQTDDLVCILDDETGKQYQVLMQVKHATKAVASNKPFRDAITAAWHDYKNPTVFNVGTDRLAIVYDADANSQMRGATQISEYARTSLTGREFLLKATKPKFSSDVQRKAIGTIASIIMDVVEGPVELDELHRFVGHLWFISHHLSNETTTEYTHLLSRIRVILGAGLAFNPTSVWGSLVNACLKFNSAAASVSLDNVDAHVSRKLTECFRLHRESGAPSVTSSGLPLAVQVEVSSRSGDVHPDQVNVTLTAGNVTSVSITATPQSDSGLSTSRSDSANKVISRQLDAINDKLKIYHYQDALGDIVSLGRDLQPFDAHQKARWYQQRAVCHWHLGKVEEASEDFLKAAELSDDDEKMVAARIRGLVLRDELNEALQAGAAALERFPDSLDIWLAIAHARLERKDVLELADVPLSLRESTDVLQLLAWASRKREDWPTAIRLCLKALSTSSAGFYTRNTALTIIIDNVIRKGGILAYRIVDDATKDALSKVVSAFEPRNQHLWAVQSSLTVADTAAYLGYAFLLLHDPESALKIVQEAKAHSISSPNLLRVELDSLNQLGRIEEFLEKGEEYIEQLNEEGLISFAQATANMGKIEVVEKIIKVASNSSVRQQENIDVLKAFRWVALWQSSKASVAKEEVLVAGLIDSNSLHLLAVGARILVAEKEEARANPLIEKVEALVAAAPIPENLMLLAELLYDARRFEKAAKCYETFLPGGLHSSLHNRLLHSYVRAGNRQKARRLIETFPVGWVEDDDARSLAIELGHSAGDWPLLAELADAEFNQAPKKASSWIFKLMAMVRVKPVAEIRSFLEGLPAKLEGSIDQITQLAAQELRYGLKESGMRRMYQLHRMHLDSAESASALMLTYLVGTEELPNMEDSLPVVAAGTSVEVMEHGGPQRFITIDPEELSGLPQTAEFKSSSSPEVAYFMGAKVGDSITIRGGLSQTRVYSVVSITSAYRRILSRTHEVMGQAFLPTPNAISIPVPTSEDGETDFSVLQEHLEASSAHIKKTFELYVANPITLGKLSEMLGKSPVDAVRNWNASCPPLDVGSGAETERHFAGALLTNPDCTYVTDAATLSSLVLFGCESALASLPKLFVSSMTSDIVHGALERAQLERASGRVFDNEGQLGYVDVTEGERGKNICQLEAIAAAIEKYCEVVPSYGPELHNPHITKLQRILSEEEHSVLLVAAEKGAHLFTVDGRFRWWSDAAMVRGIWPQVLLRYATETGVISQNTCSLATIKMFFANHRFISLSPSELLVMCYQGEAWLKYGMTLYKKYVADPATNFSSVLGVTLEFLERLAESCVQFGAFAELLKHLVEGLLRHRDCPSDLVSQIRLFLVKLLYDDSIAQFYPPAAKMQIENSQEQYRFLNYSLQEAEAWSIEPLNERVPNIRIINCGVFPWLVASKS